MKRTILTLAITLAAILAHAQSPDERVGAMMNASDWFGLREYYSEKPDSEVVSPFIDRFAKTMMACFFNDKENALRCYGELLNNHSAEMGLQNILSTTILTAQSLNLWNENEKAASIMEQVLASVREHLDSATAKSLGSIALQYRTLTKYETNKMAEGTPRNGAIPFRLDSIGSKEKRSVAIFIEGGTLNGHSADFMLDTGAGVNVISDSLALSLGLEIQDISLEASGEGVQSARLGIAREMRLGDAVLQNIPFFVMTMKSGHAEADAHLSRIQLVVGITLMNALKTITIDRNERKIFYAEKSPIPADAETNLCFAPSRILQLKAYTLGGQRILFCPDSGDNSYGTVYPMMSGPLASLIPSDAQPETIRMGGAGGYSQNEAYPLIDMPLTIGNRTVTIPRIPLLSSGGRSEGEGNMGINTMQLFPRLIFDLERMILWADGGEKISKRNNKNKIK